jgi:hypothetical protein
MRDERASAGARLWAQPRWFERAERWLRASSASLGYEPAERLLRAWRLAEPLIALHQAVSYRSIVATHEPMDRHMMGSTADWLRKVIAALRPPAEAGVPPGGGGEA